MDENKLLQMANDYIDLQKEYADVTLRLATISKIAITQQVVIEQYQKLLGVFTNSSGFAKIVELQNTAPKTNTT